MEEHFIKVNKDFCIGCAMCKNDCPLNNIKIVDKKAVIKSQECIKCGHCEAVCPKGAIKVTGFEEKTMDITEKTILNPDEFYMALKTRRTIRKYKSDKVDPDILQKIIEAGRISPSGENAQGVSYIVLDKEKDKYEKVAVKFFRRIQSVVKIWNKEVREVNIDDNFFFKKAPIAIMVIAKDKVSGSIAASNMSLMAESYGLGILYSGFFTTVATHSLKLRRLLKLKHKDKVVMTLVIGYPNIKYRRTTQKKKAVVRYL